MDGLKVRFKGETDFLVLTHDKVYEVKAIEKCWHRIVDDSGEDYLYPANLFDIVRRLKEKLLRPLRSFFDYVILCVILSVKSLINACLLVLVPYSALKINRDRH